MTNSITNLDRVKFIDTEMNALPCLSKRNEVFKKYGVLDVPFQLRPIHSAKSEAELIKYINNSPFNRETYSAYQSLTVKIWEREKEEKKEKSEAEFQKRFEDEYKNLSAFSYLNERNIFDNEFGDFKSSTLLGGLNDSQVIKALQVAEGTDKKVSVVSMGTVNRHAAGMELINGVLCELYKKGMWGEYKWGKFSRYLHTQKTFSFIGFTANEIDEIIKPIKCNCTSWKF